MPYTPGGDTQLGSVTPSADGATVTLATALPDTGLVQRKTVARDAANSLTITWTTVDTYACALVSQAAPRNIVRGGKLRAVSTWKAKFIADADIKARDRVTINGETMDVIDTDHGITEPPYLTVTLIQTAH